MEFNRTALITWKTIMVSIHLNLEHSHEWLDNFKVTWPPLITKGCNSFIVGCNCVAVSLTNSSSPSKHASNLNLLFFCTSSINGSSLITGEFLDLSISSLELLMFKGEDLLVLLVSVLISLLLKEDSYYRLVTVNSSLHLQNKKKNVRNLLLLTIEVPSKQRKKRLINFHVNLKIKPQEINPKQPPISPSAQWIWIELCFWFVVSYNSALFVAGGDDFLSFALHHHYRRNHHFILWHKFLGLLYFLWLGFSVSLFVFFGFGFPSLNCLIRLRAFGRY